MDEINIQKNPVIEPTYQLTLNQSVLKNFSGWATFCGVMDIISGASACFGIITIPYGVLKIMAGMKLLNTSQQLKNYLRTNNLKEIDETFTTLNKHFKFNGIAIIINIATSILIMVAFLLLFGFIMAMIGNYMDGLPNNNFGNGFDGGNNGDLDFDFD